MRKTLLTLATLAVLTPLSGHAQSLQTTTAAASFTASSTASSFTVSFNALTLAGFNFQNLTDAFGPFTGSLMSVSVDAVLDASVNDTWADDLTIYVDPAPLSGGGLLQVGGFSDLGAAERALWANGGSPDPGTMVIDSYTLAAPIAFGGSPADPLVWLGNGYGSTGTEGTWTGSITLNGIAPVPEPSTWALFALGGLGIAAWARRRRAV